MLLGHQKCCILRGYHGFVLVVQELARLAPFPCSRLKSSHTQYDRYAWHGHCGRMLAVVAVRALT